MERIIVSADEVWGYFQENKDDLKNHMHLIAENIEYGVEVYVTDDVGFPNIVVTIDNEQVVDETVVDKYSCERIVSKIFNDYTTSKVLETIIDSKYDVGPTEMEIEDAIAEREETLDCAVWDFVMTATDSSYIDDIGFDIILDDVKEHFLEYLARKHDIPVYRPMVIQYDDGTEVVEDYPYEHLEFDDEDNPIYK